MTTVPNTAFCVDREEWKLIINLIDSATAGIKNRNVAAAIRDIQEARSIAKTWEQSSLAGHLFKRLDDLEKAIS